MIGKHIRYGFNIRLAALALATLCFTQLNLHAQELEARGAAAATSDDSLPLESVSLTYGKISFGYGQTLQLSLTHAVDPTQTNQLLPAILVLAGFKDTSSDSYYGTGVYKSVDSGKTWTFYVNRDQLPLAGDPRTGAVALVPELMIKAPAGVGRNLPVSLEITDNLTGKVVFHNGSFVTRQQPAASSGNVYTVTFQGSLLSVTRGETLQVNLTNPLPLTLANKAVAASDYFITVKGINGEVQSVRKGMVKPGQTIVAEFDRDQLTDAGDPGTGRLGLATEIIYSLQLTPDQLAALGELPQFPVSFESVDNATGKITARLATIAVWYLRNSNSY
jgi:hypothetical protein